MIKHVIFDLGNVLVKVNLHPFVYQFSNGFKIDPEALKNNENDGAYLDFQIGKINGDEFHRITCEHYRHFVPIDRFKQIWSSMLVGEVEGSVEIVRGLLKKKYAVSLLSNTDPWHYEYSEKIIPELQQFEHIFLSYDLKMKKPDAEIFLTVTEELDARPEECLFIDDLEENISSARSLNFQTILFQNAEQLRGELKQMGIG